ncbi:MAG TPA: glycosyltransferase N-terminal domain-containing protein [Candidatus Kapabacteria bacterium]|nr:glycosyltransferase N-terminal domain-containing protein [Candidatus Kapabacteria bacterium]
MFALYNFLLPLLIAGVRIASLFDPKIRRGLAGRKRLLEETRKHYAQASIQGQRILIHVASFGELEQAKPVIAAIKAAHPDAHIHLTFFSPSGYENAAGKYDGADFISYAPLDTRKNVAQFLDVVKPRLALFTRYDVWPNMARELKRRKVVSILFAATAAESFARQLPIVRTFYRDIFLSLSKILTVSEDDKSRFEAIGLDPEHIAIAGDTRFDQVFARRLAIEQNGEHFLPDRIRASMDERGTLVFIIGSSWPSDEAIFVETVRQSIERKDNILTIIVPHETGNERIDALLAKFPGNAIRFSALDAWNAEPVIVVDGIGKLFGLYRYADVAMIGGGFGAGLHNILEAAVWGIPAIVGPKHEKSQEVGELVDRLAAFEIKTKREFDFVFWRLAESEDLRISAGKEAARFVEEHRGATERIMSEL